MNFLDFPQEIIILISEKINFVGQYQLRITCKQIYSHLIPREVCPALEEERDYKGIKYLLQEYSESVTYNIIAARAKKIIKEIVIGDIICCITIFPTKIIIALLKLLGKDYDIRPRDGCWRIFEKIIEHVAYGRCNQWTKFIRLSIKRNNVSYIEYFHKNCIYQNIVAKYAAKYGYLNWIDHQHIHYRSFRDRDIEFYLGQYEKNIVIDLNLNLGHILPGAIHYRNTELVKTIINVDHVQFDISNNRIIKVLLDDFVSDYLLLIKDICNTNKINIFTFAKNEKIIIKLLDLGFIWYDGPNVIKQIYGTNKTYPESIYIKYYNYFNNISLKSFENIRNIYDDVFER